VRHVSVLLQYVVRAAVCCSVLQCVAVCRSVLVVVFNPAADEAVFTCTLKKMLFTARKHERCAVCPCSSALQCIAVRCSVVQCGEKRCNELVFCRMLRCVAVCCSMYQCVSVCFGVLKCIAVC